MELLYLRMMKWLGRPGRPGPARRPATAAPRPGRARRTRRRPPASRPAPPRPPGSAPDPRPGRSRSPAAAAPRAARPRRAASRPWPAGSPPRPARLRRSPRYPDGRRRRMSTASSRKAVGSSWVWPMAPAQEPFSCARLASPVSMMRISAPISPFGPVAPAARRRQAGHRAQHVEAALHRPERGLHRPDADQDLRRRAIAALDRRQSQGAPGACAPGRR